MRKTGLALWAMMMALICATPAAAQKIAVLTDIHVMGPNLIEEDGTAWQNALASDRKLLDYSRAIFDQLIDRFKADDMPDILLITGDLTKDGEYDSHVYVESRLRELKKNVKVYVIPGNHDLGTSNSLIFKGTETEHAQTLEESGKSFAEMYHDYGYDSNTSVLDPNSLSYACEPEEGLVLIGIDSHTGSLSEATLNWACKQARQARAAKKQVIAMMHHPLFPHILGADIYVNTATVGDYETVRNRLADAGVRVLLSGHFHTSDIAKDWNADLTKEIYDINTGSTISYPCDYRELKLKDNMTTLKVTTVSITAITGDPTFTSEMARARLKTGIYNAAFQKIKGLVGSLLNDEQAADLADLAAMAFLIHAEGDEPSKAHEDEVKEVRDLIADYKANGSFAVKMAMALLENNFESLLTDKSNYGDKDRENRTADRDLTIEMPDVSTDLTEAITLAADGWSTYCTDVALDLTKTEGVKGYVVSSIADGYVNLQEVMEIPAEEGFILHGTGGAAYTLHATATSLEPETNLLKGTLASITAPENCYVLSSKNDITGFYPVKNGLVLPAHKAYLEIAGGSSARILIFDDNMTGIERPTADKPDADIYTLQGVRTNQLVKGVYIKNGKKLIIR
jgi:predicted phosphodiesterase